MSYTTTDIYKYISPNNFQQSTINLIICILISIILCCIAYILLNNDNNNMIDTIGVIKSANCIQTLNNNIDIIYNCDLEIEYNVGGQIYVGNLKDQSYVPRKAGDIYEISYNKNFPAIIQNKIPKNKWTITLLSSFSIVIIIIAGIIYYMTYN